MRDLIKAFLQDEAGATAIEYTLIVVGVAIVIAGVIGLIGTRASAVYATAASKFN